MLNVMITLLIVILYMGFPMRVKPLMGIHATRISLHDKKVFEILIYPCLQEQILYYLLGKLIEIGVKSILSR